LVLINRAPIKGSEVEQVAVLKQKLAKIAGLTKIEKLEKKGAE